MASKQVAVELVGRDNLSPTFKKVGASATQAGREIDSAGKSVGRFDDLSGRLSRTGAILGGVFGALSGIMADSARAAAQAEVSNERLRVSIEATGAIYEEFASQLEAAGQAAVQMGFDDEDAADAISRLTQSTGDAGRAIDDMSLAMDIARGRGISLAEATKILEYVETGRMESLRRIGIVLDENATREEAMAELQRRYAGQAEAYANTTEGFYDRIRVQLGNLQEDLGAHAGSLQTILVLLPGLSAGWTAAAAAVGSLGKAMGPAGLVAAAGLAVGGLIALTLTMEQDIPRASNEASEAIETLNELIVRLGEQGKLSGSRHFMASVIGEAEQATREANTFLETVGANYEDTLEMLSKAMGDVKTGISETIDVTDPYLTEILGLSEAQIALINTNNDQVISLEEVQGAFAGVDGAVEQATEQNRAFAETADEVQRILAEDGEEAAKAQANWAVLTQAFLEGALSADEYIAAVEETESRMLSMGAAAALATEETEETTGALADQERQAVKTGNSWINLANSNMAQIRVTRDAIKTGNSWIAMAEAGAVTAVEWADVVESAGQKLISTYEQVQSALMGTTDALNAGFQTAVGQTNAWAKQSQAVADWAEELIGAEGVYSKLDELVAKGRITGESGVFTGDSEYAQAQQAFNSILEDNAAIQEHIATIQAKQAPVMAELVSQQEDYLEGLANASVEEQTFALAMMDSATSAKALELAQAAIGDMDTFGPIVEQAANLDPYLASILEQMGLITQQPDGTWKVNVDAEEANSEFDLLTRAIDQLNQTQLLLIALLDDDPFTNTAEDVERKLSELDGTTATPTVNLNDNASGTMNAIIQKLYDIDGRTASAYVNTYYTNIGQPGYAEMDGGTTPLQRVLTAERQAANGMTATLVGERGPELLMLPGGAQVMNTEGTRSRTGGTGGDVIVNVYIENANNVEDIARQLTPAIQRAVAMTQRGRP